MNLVIDVGNTRTKYAFFKSARLINACYCIENIKDDILFWKNKGEEIDTLFSGSGKCDERIKSEIKGLSDFWQEASPQMQLPITLAYKTPETLGVDRIAISVGAVALYPGQPLLVIDTGTAYTYNYVNETGVFTGGNISPGLELRFRALHEFTARLPYVDFKEDFEEVGKDTEGAIRSGVINGLLFEIRGYVDDFRSHCGNGKIVLTGGGCDFLEKYLKRDVVFYKKLVFVGLNEILTYAKKSH